MTRYDFLWSLIQDEAQAIDGYLTKIEKLDDDDVNDKPVIDTIMMIVADERDHLAALVKLYESFNREKAAVDALEFATKAVEAWRDSKRIMKL